MRAKDFIKEDHGFLAPGSHDWEGKVGKNIWNYLKNLPGGALSGVKNIIGLDDDDEDESSVLSKPKVTDDHINQLYQQPESNLANLAKPKVTSKKPGLRTSDRTTRQGRTSRIGGEDDQ